MDGDGTLDQGEISAYMKKLFGYDDTRAREEAKNFLKQIDDDGNGRIDVDEFKRGTPTLFLETKCINNFCLFRSMCASEEKKQDYFSVFFF